MVELLKRESNTGVFLRILQNFQDTYFEEHLRTAASVLNIIYDHKVSNEVLGICRPPLNQTHDVNGFC